MFVHNLRPGVPERIGVDHATLRLLNDNLVYVTITGFGLTGPYAQRPAYDSVMQASAGFAAHQADASGMPQLIRNAVCDKTTALTAAQLITAALLARERGDGASHVHVSMLHAAIAFLWPDACRSDVPRCSRTHKTRARPHHRFAARATLHRDHTLLDREFIGLWTSPFARAGERSRCNPGDRRETPMRCIDVNEALAQWSNDELAARLEEEGCSRVVNFVDRIHDDPQ